MCTLTVAASDAGYLLAMNRDERIARGSGLMAEAREFDGTGFICPTDGNGGTWIAINEYGIALALLNWNDVVPRGIRLGRSRSRGQVIPAIISAHSWHELKASLGHLDVEGMSPFRLVGVFPAEKRICEWRWDLAELDYVAHEWQLRHWFSSSLSDTQAERLRGAACDEAQCESDTGTVLWLRRLHASHTSGPGPFSVCVHRQEVKTLSYSEVTCTQQRVQMEHFRGSPCLMDTVHPVELERAYGPALHALNAGSLAI